MINRIANFIKQNKLEDKTIIVGFSGGFDSMCLLDILSKLKNQRDFEEMKVVAAHYNHNWRGEESLREQEVCRIFAASRGIEFYTKNAPKTLKKTENDARIARYEFFEEAYDEYDADGVFTAHNKDDNAETILYRIIKGTGIIGLKGIAQKRKYFYRPLLTTYRKEIIKYCDENNLAPNSDSSNFNTNYKRNYLRLNVIPSLEKINPEVKEALNTLAKNASLDNEIIEEYISRFRKKVIIGETLNPSEYKNLSKPVKLRFLYEYIQILGLDYDSKRINEIYDFIENNITQRNGSTISLTASQWLYADEKIVETIPHKKVIEQEKFQPLNISGEGEYEFANKTFTIKKYEEGQLFVFPDSTSNFAYVDLSGIAMPITIRTRKEGDIITPFGMKGSMKLKKYMNAKGISRHKRDEIILLCKDDEILWVSGVGLSDKIGVKVKPTHVIEVK